MPHCILEYSNNIVDRPDFKILLQEINKYLAGTGLFKLNDIKSRVIGHDLFVVGDGSKDRTFITMNISILSGRDNSIKKDISDSLLKLLAQYFPKTLAVTHCSLTVQITDIQRDSYGRIIGPTKSPGNV